MNARFNIFEAGEKKSEKSPDYTGDITIGDAQSKNDIAIWVRKTKDGRKYYSGNIRPHQERDPVNAPRQEQRAAATGGIVEDNMPF